MSWCDICDRPPVKSLFFLPLFNGGPILQLRGPMHQVLPQNDQLLIVQTWSNKKIIIMKTRTSIKIHKKIIHLCLFFSFWGSELCSCIMKYLNSPVICAKGQKRGFFCKVRQDPAAGKPLMASSFKGLKYNHTNMQRLGNAAHSLKSFF